MEEVLLVDGDEGFSREMSGRLARRGYRVIRARTADEGVRTVREGLDGFVLTAAELPDSDGLPVLTAARASVPVVVTGETLSSETVFSAIRLGAYDCLPRPVDEKTLDGLLRRLQGEGRPALRCGTGAKGADAGGESELVVGRCPEMVEALKTVGAVAETDAAVLVRGESGTGKELLARFLHRASGRSGPFVAVNCAAVVETLAESELFGHERGAFTGAAERRTGCFEQADGGTLFLDEIGEAAPAFQAKLLRVLDGGAFCRVGGREPIRPDVRVVAATNGDLEDQIQTAAFRADLYYRLGEVVIRLPALRDRRQDIPDLALRMLERLNRRMDRRVPGMSGPAMERLVAHHWPGNVRELQNVVNRAGLLCRGRTILPCHLQGLEMETETDVPDRILRLEDMERSHIARVLDIAGWNRGRACRLLGISRPTLRRKMRQYGMGPVPDADGP